MPALNTIQIVFLIVAPILVMICISVFVVYPITKRNRNVKYKEYYYKKIYEVANDEDYYLINNFRFKFDSRHIANIDHILFANKYIYIILDHHLEGHITGKEDDEEVIINPDNGERRYYVNPLKEVEDITYKLAVVTGIDYSMLIGIAMINNEVNCAIENHSSKFYIIQRNNFPKLISQIESRDIQPFDEKQLERVVQALSKTNLIDKHGK